MRESSTPLLMVSAVAAGALLGHRPRGVVHLVDGAATKSGRWANDWSKPWCGARTLRLQLLSGLSLGGRRFCRRCQAETRRRAAAAGPLFARDDIAGRFGHLTVDHLARALAWSGCPAGAPREAWEAAVDRTHQLGFVAAVVAGPKPFRRPDPATDPDGAALHDLHDAIAQARRVFATRALTVEQVETAHIARDRWSHELRTAWEKRARDEAIDRARERRGYRMPWERELLASTD